MRLFGLIMRKDAREAVLILLYGDLFDAERVNTEISLFFREKKLNDSDKLFADNLYRSVKEHEEFLLNAISDIVSPACTVYLFCSFTVPNRRYLLNVSLS